MKNRIIAFVVVVIFYSMVFSEQILAQVTNAAVVYTDSVCQVIRGFGGANVLIFGRPDMTPAEVQTAFGNDVGQVGMTIMRLSIPPDSTQFRANVPSALAAQNLGAAIIATPWTPPAWMKSNNSQSGGMLLPANYTAFAAHLKAFADTMAAYGVSLYGISVQNEPDFNASYQSCLWNATQFLNFMRYNAPAVGVPVFMPESDVFNHQLSDLTLNDSLAAAHTAFIGGHIYGVSPTTYPLAFSKGKEQWMTEYLINSGSSSASNPTGIDTGWSGAIQTAKSIHDCMVANMSAYVWWYIVRFYGPIDDGTFNSNNTGKVTHKGYVMSQYAKFVRPGFYRISTTTSPVSNVYVTAYKDSAKVVVVALNMGSNSVTLPFFLQGGTASSVTPYVTSSTENCIQGNNITVSKNSFSATLEASSVTTFVVNSVTNGVDGFLIPQTIQLSQNYPNPFNPTTQIAYSIAHPGYVSLKVYNLLGQEVATLYEGNRLSGNYEVTFDGSKIMSGVYFYRLKASDLSSGSGKVFTETKKLILLK